MKKSQAIYSNCSIGAENYSNVWRWSIRGLSHGLYKNCVSSKVEIWENSYFIGAKKVNNRFDNSHWIVVSLYDLNRPDEYVEFHMEAPRLCCKSRCRRNANALNKIKKLWTQPNEPNCYLLSFVTILKLWRRTKIK